MFAMCKSKVMHSALEQQCQVALRMLNLRRGVCDCRRAFDYVGLKFFLFFIKVFHAVTASKHISMVLGVKYIQACRVHVRGCMAQCEGLVNVPLRC